MRKKRFSTFLERIKKQKKHPLKPTPIGYQGHFNPKK
jgi:hypothetical protein